MSNLWIDPKRCESLAVLVESVAGPMLIENQASVCLELDIDVWMKVPADPEHTSRLIETLVSHSLAEMPDGGDLTITAIETPQGVELEIADTGQPIENRPDCRPMSAAALGAEMKWQNCPQGGGCVTVRFPGESQQHRAAA